MWANLVAGQLPGEKDGQAVRGDGAAIGNVAFELEQAVLRIGDLFAAFQIAQLPSQLPRPWAAQYQKRPLALLACGRRAPDTDGQLHPRCAACLFHSTRR